MISDETIQAIRDFTTQRDWDQYYTPENLAKSISIEAAELLECFQWTTHRDRHEDAVNDTHVAEELADVLTYCIMMADRMGFDLDEIINAKLDMTKKKYPVNSVRDNFEAYQALHQSARSQTES
ncbi:MAG: nucleotide pyrophosphohydrolase [Bifidobacterium sp.]|uniref:nucleotide pyrophosphohydrolase n=1 Tax=Bifidobacterium sp. TaxID=41200 RepID=UPI0039E9D1A3